MKAETERIVSRSLSQQKAIQSAINGLLTALPAQIVRVDFSTLTATVQPTIQAKTRKADGSTVFVNLPELLDVPIVFPHGGGCSLTFPLKAGDEGLVVLSSVCIDSWWQSSGVQVPFEFRHNDLSDAFFIAGCWSKPKAITASSSCAQLKTDDGQAFVQLDPSSKKITAQTSGDIDMVCSTWKVVASSGATIQAPQINLVGNLSNSGGGSPASMEAGMDTPKDVVAGGISLKSHVHSGVESGNKTTGAPQ